MPAIPLSASITRNSFSLLPPTQPALCLKRCFSCYFREEACFFTATMWNQIFPAVNSECKEQKNTACMDVASRQAVLSMKFPKMLFIAATWSQDFPTVNTTEPRKILSAASWISPHRILREGYPWAWSESRPLPSRILRRLRWICPYLPERSP